MTIFHGFRHVFSVILAPTGFDPVQAAPPGQRTGLGAAWSVSDAFEQRRRDIPLGE
jgi:hypothetical protein